MIEGVGINHITDNVAAARVDTAYTIPDQEALPYVFDLLKHEGLCLGGSSGLNIAGAVRLAEELGPGHTIVTILCDYGTRYQSKLFNPVFPPVRSNAGFFRQKGALSKDCDGAWGQAGLAKKSPAMAGLVGTAAGKVSCLQRRVPSLPESRRP